MTGERVLDNPARRSASFWANVRGGLGGWGPQAWLMLLLAGLNGVTYPLIAYLWRPQELFSVSLLYRGDPVYFPLISFLSRLQFGDRVILENLGSGITSYPFFCMLPHALGYRLFGPYGYAVADVFAFVACFLALAGFFHLLGVRGKFAGWIALLIVSGFFGWLTGIMKIYLGIDRPVFLLPTWRLARPLVTETFFLLTMFYLGAILIAPGALRKKRVWALAGFFFAALLQGSFDWALLLAYCFPLEIIYLFCKFPKHRRSLLAGVAIFSLVASLAAIPFFLQRLYESPEVVRRLGIISPRHFYEIALWTLPRPLMLGTAVLVTLALLYWLNKNHKAAFTFQARVLGVIALMCAVAYIGSPLTALIFGRIAQPAAFYERFIKLGSYLLVICGLYLAGAAWEYATERGKTGTRARPGIVALGIAVPVLLGALAIYCDAARAWYAARDRRYIHHGNIFSKELNSIENFRAGFGALARELSKPEYSEAKVLGTFNRQLHFWWLAFRHRYSFLVDPYASPAPDAELERRLVLFCREIGMDEKDFNSWIRQPALLSSWLGGHKYIATRAYSFAPLAQYSAAGQRKIRETHIYKYNNLLPANEQTRLLDRFRKLRGISPEAKPRLDLIVLTKIPSLQKFAPAANLYTLAWENKLFRLYRAKSPVEKHEIKKEEAGNPPLLKTD